MAFLAAIPAWVSTAATVASAVVTGYSQYRQGQAQAAAATYNANVAESNAKRVEEEQKLTQQQAAQGAGISPEGAPDQRLITLNTAGLQAQGRDAISAEGGRPDSARRLGCGAATGGATRSADQCEGPTPEQRQHRSAGVHQPEHSRCRSG